MGGKRFAEKEIWCVGENMFFGYVQRLVETGTVRYI
jgi:hypothetical protein